VATATATKTYELVIPNWRPTSVNLLLSRNPRSRTKFKRRDAEMILAHAILARVPRALGPRRVSYRVTVPAWRHAPDPSNILKSAEDALVSCGLLIDDSARWYRIGEVDVVVGGALETVISLEDLGG
jgi:Holliday junction resolvase RusA-like endonuclease